MSKLRQTRDAYGEALAEVGATYPERFLDFGISEMDMVSAAAGMAASGFVPYCNSFAMFITAHCYDQIRIQIAYPGLHVVLAGSRAGLSQGTDGASHQSLEDVALMRALLNMAVLVPADHVGAAAMTKAVADLDGPAYLRLGRYPVPDIHDDTYCFELGRATRLRQGEDVTIFCCGHMVSEALQAAELLANRDTSATVLNMSTIKPLDRAAVVKAMHHTPLRVTVEEYSVIGGLGSAVAEVMAGVLVLGAKAGVDPAIVHQVLSGGYAQSRVADVRGPRVIQRDFEPGFRGRFHFRDLTSF